LDKRDQDCEAFASKLLPNSQQTFGRSSAHFTCAVRSRIHRKESKNCAMRVADGRVELSGRGTGHHGDADKPVLHGL